MPSPSSTAPTILEPALAAARLVESALELARAEAKLVSAHAHAALVRTVGALLAGMLATSAAQVTLLLIALCPVLFAAESRSAFLFTLLPSVCLSALGTWLAVLAWLGLRSPAAVARVGQ